jgi:hypothetical protein
MRRAIMGLYMYSAVFLLIGFAVLANAQKPCHC